MYESYYHLRTKPFSLLPDSDFLYAGSTHRAAYSTLEYGLIHEAAFMVLSGEPGMGKTSLLRKLIAEHGTKHSIGLVTNARSGPFAAATLLGAMVSGTVSATLACPIGTIESV